VRDLSIAMQSFPGNMRAKMFGVVPKEFFDLPDNDVAQQNVQVKF
jgi:hypothetical protein